jgi:hypothetical protein
MRNWVIAIGATVAVMLGSILAYPGQDGRHLAGLALSIAGLQSVLWLMKK